jgi:sugar phosphate isomerase/epimerase
MSEPLKLHNAMWPGLVGKSSQGGDEADISLDRMLELTVNAEVDGQRFDGVDLFLFHPHTDPEASSDEIRKLADKIADKGLAVGSMVAPVWPGTVGGSAMGSAEDQANFLKAIELSCKIANTLNDHGVRKYGVIRIDTAGGVGPWAEDPVANTAKIADTFKKAGKIAADHGERLAAEGEVCWGGMHSWKDMLDLLEQVDMQGTVGFQADLAHTYLYLLGVNAPQHAVLKEGYSDDEFWAAYESMTDKLRPWTTDFHVAQNAGTVHGSGDHEKTGRHCPADDPNGKLNVTRCSSYWLKDAGARGMQHVCWDGCMFSNEKLEDQSTWNTILSAMIKVRDAMAETA